MAWQQSVIISFRGASAATINPFVVVPTSSSSHHTPLSSIGVAGSAKVQPPVQYILINSLIGANGQQRS